jgi:hypothetical protein
MNEELKEEVGNQQREKGEALAKAIARKAGGRTNQEQQDFYLGLLTELELRAGKVVEAGIRQKDEDAA